MKTLNVLLLITLLLAISSCDKSEEDTNIVLTVSSETVLQPIVPSNEKVEQMIVNDEFKRTIIMPMGSIQNFEYEKGFEYKLLVRKKHIKNPPQDSGNKTYTLIELLSKEKK